LAVASFTATQLRALQKTAIRATLAKLGFNRNISRDIVFGSPLFGGLGLFNLVTEQGIAQLQLLIRHLRAGTPQGTLFIIGLSWWHLVAGFSTSLWENPTAKIPYVERTWYTSLKDFLAQINGQIHIPLEEFIHWHTLQESDEDIIAIVSAIPGVSRADLAAFNRCQLFLGIIFLSEITTPDGCSFARDAWLGTRPRFTPFLWPYQPNPGPKSWRILRQLLANAFLVTIPKRVTPTLKDLLLWCPLGNWLTGSTWLQHRFTFFYSAISAASTTSTDVLPPDCAPVDELSSSGSILAFRGTDIAQHLEPTPAQPTTFAAYLDRLPQWDRRLLESITLHDEQGLLAQIYNPMHPSISCPTAALRVTLAPMEP
jgi:hypothetical protein